MRIDGKQIADKILEKLKKDIQKLKSKGISPKLAIILVGEDPASVAYVKRKEIKAKEIGIETKTERLPKTISQKKLLETVKRYASDKNIHGIIIQQPLPKHIDTQKIVNSVPADKDIDGFLPDSKFEMPIAMAVLEILKEIYKYSPRRSPSGHLRGGVAPAAHLGGEFESWLKSKKIIVIGKGETGGRPTINMLKKLGIEPQIIDSKTKNPTKLTKTADIVISAVGKSGTVKPNMLKKGAILIGIGIARDKSARLTGDYDQNEIKDIASFYTPTPGGVGPVNVTMLLKNLITAAQISPSH